MRGPWYVSVAAVRDYLWLTRRPDATDGDGFYAAEQELVQMCEETVASGREPKRLASGALAYRGPKPRRLTLVVGPGEGDRPCLTAVMRSGAGTPPHRR